MSIDDRIYELHAEVCRVLANQWRLRLIELLRDGERPLKELVADAGIPLANVSQHLNLMRTAGVVEVRREGSRSFYRLTNPKILKAFDLMRDILRDRLEGTRGMAQALSRVPRR